MNHLYKDATIYLERKFDKYTKMNDFMVQKSLQFKLPKYITMSGSKFRVRINNNSVGSFNTLCEAQSALVLFNTKILKQ